MAIGIKQLKTMSMRELKQVGRSELRETYQNVKKMVSSRVQTFESRGAGGAVPEQMRAGLPSARGLTDKEILQNMREALGWMRGARSTYAGYQRTEDQRRSRMQEAMPDMDFSTPERWQSFGEFMGEMQDRYGTMWKAVSNQVRDLYREAVRLNVDPHAFMKNYDYWADHIKDLEQSDPIRRKSDRKLQPSDYARKLGLEKIGGGKRK